MIHCVNLNATMDTLLVLPDLTLGGVNRAVAALSYPGGKGNNAARAVATLGHKPNLFAFTGKKEKPTSEGFYREQGVKARLQVVPGHNRPCFILLDGGRNQETVLNSPSQLKLNQPAANKLLASLLKAVKPGDIVTLSGSLPEGLKDDTYATFIHAIQAKGGVCLLDSYGPGLAKGVTAAPFLVKPNADELGDSFGVPVKTREQVLVAARRLLRYGVRAVVVTLGERGALAVSTRETVYVTPLPTPRGLLSPVGCGDSFLGGLAWGLHSCKSLADCLRWATSAAWANLATPGAVFFSKKLVKAQVPLVKVSRMTA
jgi:1-phosphofructokinase family hexose kinase